MDAQIIHINNSPLLIVCNKIQFLIFLRDREAKKYAIKVNVSVFFLREKIKDR